MPFWDGTLAAPAGEDAQTVTLWELERFFDQPVAAVPRVETMKKVGRVDPCREEVLAGQERHPVDRDVNVSLPLLDDWLFDISKTSVRPREVCAVLVIDANAEHGMHDGGGRLVVHAYDEGVATCCRLPRR